MNRHCHFLMWIPSLEVLMWLLAISSSENAVCCPCQLHLQCFANLFFSTPRMVYFLVLLYWSKERFNLTAISEKPSSCPRCSRIINHPKLTYGNLVFNVCPDTLRSHHTKLPADAPSLWVHKNSWNSFLFKHPALYSLGVKLLLAGGWGLDPPSTTHYSWYKLIGFCSFLQLYLYNFILK